MRLCSADGGVGLVVEKAFDCALCLTTDGQMQIAFGQDAQRLVYLLLRHIAWLSRELKLKQLGKQVKRFLVAVKRWPFEFG